MKKTILLLTALLILSFSVNTFAATPGWQNRDAAGAITIPVTGTRLPFSLKPSANVFFAWGVDAAGLTYTVASLHTSGSFIYATSSVDTNIYRMPFTSTQVVPNADGLTAPTVSIAIPDTPVSPTVGAVWTGWTAAK